MKVSSATILICTYNRADLLRETLAALQRMTLPDDCACEIILVDNNSTDSTPDVVADAARNGPLPIVYLKETRQGKSFALNTGLAQCTSDIVALTDDDVLPEAAWLARIVAVFRERPVTFVFGKVLPRWSCMPPPELLTPPAQAIWGPLAIVDYGDTPMDYLPESTGQRLPIGANLAVARSAMLTIGGWRNDLGKVNNTLIAGEDHEIFMSFRRANLYAGYYDPTITVRHYVPASRLSRRYFRRWFFWLGKTQALMFQDLFLEVDMTRVPRVFGVPRFMYRQAARQVVTWLRRLGSKDALATLIEELRAVQYLGLLTEAWRRRLRGAPDATR
jgi:glycosyltransferase involved in cell wall biosynthesis